jgi:predicted glutamine amidotransferase
MCLIIYKDNKTPISGYFYKSIARSYYLRNQDGFGYALKRDKEIQLYKDNTGTIEDFIKRIKSLNVRPSDELMIHLRKRSAGTDNIKNIQPQIITNEEEILSLKEITNIKKQGVFSHNGTMMTYQEHNKVLSDTSFFNVTLLGLTDAYSFLSNLLKLCKTDILKLINYESNRLVFIFPNKPTILLGYFKKDGPNEKIQYYFSNRSYEFKNENPTAYQITDNFKLHGLDNSKPLRHEYVKKFELMSVSTTSSVIRPTISSFSTNNKKHVWCRTCQTNVLKDTSCRIKGCDINDDSNYHRHLSMFNTEYD